MTASPVRVLVPAGMGGAGFTAASIAHVVGLMGDIRAAANAAVGTALRRPSRADTARRRALTGVVGSSITPSGMLRA